MIGLGAAQTEEQEEDESPPGMPILTFDLTRAHIALSGDVSSVAHESILRQRTQALFPRRTMSFDLHERPALPPGWALVSETALRAAAETWSSVTEITASRIRIHGITGDALAWKSGLALVQQRLLPGMRLKQEVSEIRPAGSLDLQCTALFESAMHGRKIEFPHAGATLGTATEPILDELIQISADCPDASIAITGHTDKSGDEGGNLALSEARAEAVAAYLAAQGIAVDRLIVRGAGSSQPLATEDSAQANQKNRRIDVEMSFPQP